jgi:F-type H+-transporting ATPase subunit a
MITNLFSVFDPAAGVLGLSLNWVSVFLGLFLSPFAYWLVPGRLLFLFNKIFLTLHREFRVLLGPSFKPGITLVFVALFLYVVFNNFLGLYPYIFTRTSHLRFTLRISLPL